MVKGNPKSSASSGTRKKHLKKHAQPDDIPPKDNKPKVKGERGKKKSEPRVKMYIPPVKPAPVQPDPLETTGLAHALPADLLVLLRNISKKAQVTKTRALEELQISWVNQCLKEGRDSLLTYTLVEMLPVWLHHVSALFVNSSRRVRLLAASLHTSLLQIPPVREQVIFFLRETAPPSQLENILGTWCLAMHDIDRSVSATAFRSWKEIVISEGSPSTNQLLLNQDLISLLNSFAQRVVLDPTGVYLYLNPLPPPPPPPSVTKKGTGKGSSAPTPRKDDGDQTPRVKQEEQEEGEQDRSARLRIAGLGAVRWLLALSANIPEDRLSFYSNLALWSILHPAESCPWAEVPSFGFAQPNVRKAGWTLLQELLQSHKSHKDHTEQLVPTLGTAILRSAWIEVDSIVQSAMWQPLLVFLKQYPQSWALDESRKERELNDESDSELESEAEDNSKDHTYVSKGQTQPSQAFQEFLQFLRTGCSGSPTQGYPAVVIIVSTIPSHILNSTGDPTLPPLSQFFTSFWEAVDSRALSSLHRIVASAAFLSSLLECLVFLIKRMRNAHLRSAEEPSSSNDECEDLVRQQFSTLWDQLSSKKLKVEERAAARLLAQTLEAIFAVHRPLYEVAWDVVAQGMESSSSKQENVHLVSVILKVFYDRFKKERFLKEHSQDLLKQILNNGLDKCEEVLNKALLADSGDDQVAFELLVRILDQFRDGLFIDSNFSDRIDSLMCRHSFQIMSISNALLLSYLTNRRDENKALETWHQLLSTIASKAVSGQALEQNSLESLLQAAQKGQLPNYLKPRDGELDALVGDYLESVLSEPAGSSQIAMVHNVLTSSDYFASESGFDTFLQVIIATFSENVNQCINLQNSPVYDFETVIHLIQATFDKVKGKPQLVGMLLPNIFFFCYLLPSIGSGGSEIELTPSQRIARALWEEWLHSAADLGKEDVSRIIKNRLKELLEDINVNPTPEDIQQMVSEKPPGLQIDLLHDLFPSPSQMDSMLKTLNACAIDPSIGVLDPLMSTLSSSSHRKSESPTETDQRGLGVYARIVLGLLETFADERWLAKRNIWALRHFYSLSIYAQDLQSVPSASSKSAVFNDKVAPVTLLHIIEKVRQLSFYLLNSAEGKEDDKARQVILERLLDQSSRKDPKEGLTQLQVLLFDAIDCARQGDSIRDARVLKMILDPLLADGIDIAEADLWVQLGRKMEKEAPQTSITIIAIVTATGAEPPKLVRYRNELAAGLLGIKIQKANTEGLLTLRKLFATAPDPNGEVEFLPPPRAINLVKACQSWVLAENEEDDEEDLDEEVQSAMLPIFVHLAPILQNMPGSHWAFIFDVLEAVLESSSSEKEDGGEDDEGGYKLVGLSRALKLVVALEDLAKRNKSLMAAWAERRIEVFTVIRDLNVVGSDPAKLSSVPRSACRELVLDIVQDLPSSLIDQDTLSKMCHLIDDPSYVVQKMAYGLLKAAARTRTEHFVIETGVDTEGAVQASLPVELLDIILRQMDFGDRESSDNEEGEEQSQNLFGYLLGWMLVFDLFQDASFKVKSNYIDQLRSLNVVIDHFIPCFLGFLRLDKGGLTKAFKLDIWAVDQFYVELYKPGNPHTIPVLAAHLYYRSLLTIPSLIHSWMLDCKDRQLSNTVTTYTSTHFSPVLIRAELEHVRSHAVSDGLADDSMSIKVATAINEVVAAYLVDEHQMEIKLRIPADWPLHKIDVRDVKRVGVDENRWRAWVLGVQQTIWAHNGRIIDGLGLFKKNATLHFEGQVECAICYSIISVMDGSLPKKPCKTCKNRFHAGCLYKWFNSSHSSSCPLCRSDII